MEQISTLIVSDTVMMKILYSLLKVKKVINFTKIKIIIQSITSRERMKEFKTHHDYNLIRIEESNYLVLWILYTDIFCWTDENGKRIHFNWVRKFDVCFEYKDHREKSSDNQSWNWWDLDEAQIAAVNKLTRISCIKWQDIYRV